MQFDKGILSKREQAFFDKLNCGAEIEIDELIKLVEKKEGKKIKRQNAIICIKYLSSKISQYGWVIRRTSGIGAGQKAIYMMEEMF